MVTPDVLLTILEDVCCMGHPRALNRPRRVVLQDVRSLRTAYMAAELFPP